MARHLLGNHGLGNLANQDAKPRRFRSFEREHAHGWWQWKRLHPSALKREMIGENKDKRRAKLKLLSPREEERRQEALFQARFGLARVA